MQKLAVQKYLEENSLEDLKKEFAISYNVEGNLRRRPRNSFRNFNSAILIFSYPPQFLVAYHFFLLPLLDYRYKNVLLMVSGSK